MQEINIISDCYYELIHAFLMNEKIAYHMG